MTIPEKRTITLDGREYCAAVDAAKFLGVTRGRVSQMVKAGIFAPRYVGASCLIPLSQLEEYENDKKAKRSCMPTL